MGAAILGWLLATSWQVAVLVLVVLVAQRLFGRWLTPRWRYALWCLVVLRLFLPAQPAVSSLAVDWELSALRSPASEPAWRAPLRGEREAPADPIAEAETEAEAAREPAVPPLPNPRAAARRNDLGAAPEPDFEVGAEPAAAAAARADEPSAGLLWRAPLAAGWALVALLLLARDLRRERGFRLRLRRAERVDDPAVLASLDACRRSMGVARRVELLRTDLVSSPAVCGFVRPRILLPATVLKDFPASELRHVFLHELAHLRRGDVPFNALLLVAQRLYWFHPLVWLAIGRLRAAQEATRDWEALARAEDSDPVPYARTLLRLLEQRSLRADGASGASSVGFLQGGNAMKWRILMITRFRSGTRSGAFLGLVLVALLGWTAFTTAASSAAPQPAVSEATPAGEQLASIRVERQRPAEAWRAEIKEKLQQRLNVRFEGAYLSETLEFLRQVTGVNFILGERYFDDWGDSEVHLRADDLTVEQTLNLITRKLEEVGWCIAREAVFVGYEDKLPARKDLRFYDVEPLVFVDEDGFDDTDDVLYLTQELTGSRLWDVDGASIDMWRGLMVVMHNESTHARVESALSRMLNRGRQPEVAEPEWKGRLREALQQRISVSFDGEDAVWVGDAMGEMTGLPIVYPDRFAGEHDISLELSDATLAHALEWLAEASEKSVFLVDGAIVFDEWPPIEVEFYEVGELLDIDPEEDDWGDSDGLEDIIRSHIDPESWDARPECSLYFWRDLMVVCQSRPVLDEISGVLDALRRISDG
ncbi:MAG: M56 family metallopeptidase [Planctomycetota bacterium]